MKVCLSILYLALLISSVSAQSIEMPVTVRGEIVLTGINSAQDLSVELAAISRAGFPARTAVMSDGTFEHRNVESGDYELRVVDTRGSILSQQLINVRGMSVWVVVRLLRPDRVPVNSGVVSVEKLLHPIPAKAIREFERASEASRAGDLKKVFQHLSKALRIHPDYMEAHNNLGVYYMNTNHFGLAADEFRRAVQIEPSSDMSQLNLGLALLMIGDHEQAEFAIRRALELAPRSTATHYALGQVLFTQGKHTVETLESLQRAVVQFPLARLLVARLLVMRGDIAGAAGELQRYLDSGRPEQRREVQTSLRILTQAVRP